MSMHQVHAARVRYYEQRDNDKEYSIQRYQDEPRLIKRNDDINTEVTTIEETMSERTMEEMVLSLTTSCLGSPSKSSSRFVSNNPCIMRLFFGFFIFSAITMPRQALHQNNRYKDLDMMLACHIQ
ncbi:MAG: hypothetical protein M3Y53_07990 [Thermoproteota archaeon]|nr:hypothetical protein [Thermoproteota archaeon]